MSATGEAVLGQRIGELLGGRYRILRSLGAGGMGEVYEAENERIGKRVAVKILAAELKKSPEIVERFTREARAATRAHGPHVVEMLDVGTTDDDLPFLVMELLAGEPLSRLLQRGVVPPGDAVRIAREIASGLGSAHEAGVVHRDLKPDNVFLASEAGRRVVKILDFGISKLTRGEVSTELTRTGSAMGTPSYMAPEQVEARRDIDARADVWALGVVLYRMLTGTMPFEADSYGLMLVRILQEPPRPLREVCPEVSIELAEVVHRCLAKVPTDRYPRGHDVVQALDGLPEATLPVSEAEAPVTSASRSGPRTPPSVGSAPRTPTPGDRTRNLRERAADAVSSTGTTDPDGFRLPRDEYPFDLSAILATVPEDATVKGMFLQSVVDRVPDGAALFERAKVERPRRIVPFADVDYRDYMRVLLAAAEIVFPRTSPTVALRRFHQDYYATFSATLAGKVTFGVLGRDASRILPIGARGWQVNVRLGRVTAETLAPRHVLYTFADYPSLICECCDVGVIEGALRFLGEAQGVVRLRPRGPQFTEIDIRW